MVLPVVAIGPILPSLIGTSVGSGATVAVGGTLISGLAQALGPILIGQSLTPRTPAASKIKPGEFLRAALEIQALTDRGLDPVFSTDPNTGNFVVSTKDQASRLPTILQDRAIRKLFTPTQDDLDRLLTARTEFIDAAAGIPPPPAAPQSVGAVMAPPRATARLVPGVGVTRGNQLQPKKRQGGPCAGTGSGFARVSCSRGGFA